MIYLHPYWKDICIGSYLLVGPLFGDGKREKVPMHVLDWRDLLGEVEFSHGGLACLAWRLVFSSSAATISH